MNTPVEKLLPDNSFWKYFLQICSIPHPSGHEERLRDFLISEAVKHNLLWRVDKAGNLAIDRAGAPGWENAPVIILQAHLDMVPQAAEGVEFDFLRDSIVPVVEGDWVTTGGRTTLGADDGMGVALAMELLTDDNWQCGALRGVFTVSEETGLGGAEDIDPEFLAGDMLFNLDSDVVFTIGCAGGGRFEGKAILPAQPPRPDGCAVKITLQGMHGGHSGVDIHLNVGSATVAMGEFLSSIASLELSGVSAGTLHNAIAREARVIAVIAPEDFEKLRQSAAEYTAEKLQKLIPAPDKAIILSVEKLPSLPGKVLTPAAQQKLFEVWNNLPHGVLAENPDHSTATSCNLAVVSGQAGSEWSFVLLARSLYDRERDAVINKAMELLQNNGFSAATDSVYSSWEPRWDSPLLEKACSIYHEITGKTAERFVIHGGLEPGIFCGINPDLQMLSFAPATQSVHSPQEKLSISDSETVRKLLRKLITELKK